MSDRIEVGQLIAAAAGAVDEGAPRASTRLKSRIYSRLVLEQAESGPLLSLSETKAAGRPLCVFEELVEIAPVSQAAKRTNYCRVCHARLAGEHIEHAPIYWPHCPYVRFQKP